MDQRAYLRAIKKEVGLKWDSLAEMAGINPRALKTYRMPETSADHRKLPDHAKAALEGVLQYHRRRTKTTKKAG